MDVCVAKLKSLDKKKALAIEALTTQTTTCKESACKRVVLEVSSPEEAEIKTPTKLAPCFENTKRGTVQTIQVYMDPPDSDEILRYYEGED